MAIYHPPIPPVFTGLGSLQPYGGRRGFRDEEPQQVNNPPFTYGGPNTVQYEVQGLAQPNPWTYAFFGNLQPFQRRLLPIVVVDVAVNDPPFTHPERTVQGATPAILAAQPNPWTYSFLGFYGPFMGIKMSPDIPGFSIDRPPFQHRGRTDWYEAELIALWQPDPWVYAFMGRRQPYEGGRLNPTVMDVVVNNPPFGMRNRVTLFSELPKAWEPQPPLPWNMHGSFRIQQARGRGYILG